MDREKLKTERRERKKLKKQQRMPQVIKTFIRLKNGAHDLEVMHVYHLGGNIFKFVLNPLRLQYPYNPQEEEDSSSSKKGVIYVGHIPHGFFEREMRGFFSQFGTVTRLRLARSRKV